MSITVYASYWENFISFQKKFKFKTFFIVFVIQWHPISFSIHSNAFLSSWYDMSKIIIWFWLLALVFQKEHYTTQIKTTRRNYQWYRFIDGVVRNYQIRWQIITTLWRLQFPLDTTKYGGLVKLRDVLATPYSVIIQTQYILLYIGVTYCERWLAPVVKIIRLSELDFPALSFFYPHALHQKGFAKAGECLFATPLIQAYPAVMRDKYLACFSCRKLSVYRNTKRFFLFAFWPYLTPLYIVFTSNQQAEEIASKARKIFFVIKAYCHSGL